MRPKGHKNQWIPAGIYSKQAFRDIRNET